MRSILAVCLILSGTLGLYGQTGTIRGKVADAKTGEVLIGASVFIPGTTNGTITDFDGNYSLNNVPAGPVALTISYVSYQTQVFEDLEVGGKQVVTLNTNLSPLNHEIDEVVVTARKREKTEAAIMIMKKNMPSFLDGISSQQISRMGDSDAASALKRVTGVSVEGGKYVYVRGLSDRYSNTTLNGAQIPGLDPERNSVQMDLFPSNIIENLMVYKTFTPDLPSNTTGGLVNIVTKDFPENFTMQFSGNLGYNATSNLRKDFLSYRGGNLDFIGMDDGTRSIPDEVHHLTENGQIPDIYTGADDTLGIISSAFSKEMDNIRQKSFLDQSYSFSTGNKVTLFNRDLGFNLVAYYSHKYSMHTGGRDEKYSVTSPDSPSPKRLVNDDLGVESVIWATLGNFSYKFNSNHMLGFTFMRNQSGDKSSRYTIGIASDPDAEDIIEKKLGWMERSISSGQLKGKHVITDLNKAFIDWQVSYILSRQDEPDLRFFFMDFDYNPNSMEDTLYTVRLNNLPSRFYREMEESNLDLKINYLQPFRFLGNHAKVKVGGAIINKDRLSNENRFDIKRQGGIPFDGTAEGFLSDQNILSSPYQFNVVYYANSNLTDAQNSYRGSEKVTAGYAMVDLPFNEKFRILTGLRYEYSDIFIENLVDTLVYASRADSYKRGGFKDSDYLPSANLTYAISPDINFRAGYNRTIARPVFRELAPYASYDYKAGLRKIGNPDLERTIIENVDIRWEWFIAPGEILSFSAFYKYFQDPIELRDAEKAANPEIHFENIEDSRLYGMEFEFRKNLDFFEMLKHFSISTNITLVKSIVQEDSARLASARLVNPDWPVTRQMFGMAPYVVNAHVNYNYPELGLDVNVGFNVSGKKLSLVNKAATPDVYEQPLPILDFNISKRFRNGIAVKFSAENLIDPEFRQTYDFLSSEGYFRKYNLGRSFSLGLSYLIN